MEVQPLSVQRRLHLGPLSLSLSSASPFHPRPHSHPLPGHPTLATPAAADAAIADAAADDDDVDDDDATASVIPYKR